MNVLIPFLISIACVIILKLMGSPEYEQEFRSEGANKQHWRRFLYTVEIAAGIVAVWQANGA